MKRWSTVLVLSGIFAQSLMVGLEMVLVASGHVIKEYLVLFLTISREVGSVVHFIEWHLLQSSVVHLEIKFILLFKVII